MKANTKLRIISFFFLVAVVVILKEFYVVKALNVALCTLALAAYAAGMFIGCSYTSRGKVEYFNELADDVYTYLGEIDGVHILKYRTKSGERQSFAVFGFTPCDRASNRISIGASFRKIGKDVILL